ncbi:MAG: twin-arginine translocation signal domain-containing protein, partial [Paracoccaceae bacterium]
MERRHFLKGAAIAGAGA